MWVLASVSKTAQISSVTLDLLLFSLLTGRELLFIVYLF